MVSFTAYHTRLLRISGLATVSRPDALTELGSVGGASVGQWSDTEQAATFGVMILLAMIVLCIGVAMYGMCRSSPAIPAGAAGDARTPLREALEPAPPAASRLPARAESVATVLSKAAAPAVATTAPPKPPPPAQVPQFRGPEPAPAVPQFRGPEPAPAAQVQVQAQAPQPQPQPKTATFQVQAPPLPAAPLPPATEVEQAAAAATIQAKFRAKKKLEITNSDNSRGSITSTGSNRRHYHKMMTAGGHKRHSGSLFGGAGNELREALARRALRKETVDLAEGEEEPHSATDSDQEKNKVGEAPSISLQPPAPPAAG